MSNPQVPSLRPSLTLLILLALVSCRQPSHPVGLVAPGELDMQIAAWDKPAWSGQCRDAAALKAFFALLATADEIDDHKCGDRMTLQFAGGVLGLLPGHKADKYQFRWNGKAYELDRETLLQAMEKLGLPRAQIPLKC